MPRAFNVGSHYSKIRHESSKMTFGRDNSLPSPKKYKRRPVVWMREWSLPIGFEWNAIVRQDDDLFFQSFLAPRSRTGHVGSRRGQVSCIKKIQLSLAQRFCFSVFPTL